MTPQPKAKGTRGNIVDGRVTEKPARDDATTLSDSGIDKNLAHRARMLKALFQPALDQPADRLGARRFVILALRPIIDATAQLG
jgi:hypothetical protein